MPIRFRCQYCSQLLGIARRKAGTTVTCPTCHNQVLVPESDEARTAAPAPAPAAASAPASAPAPPAAPPSPGGQPFLFERDDFEDLLQPGAPSIVADRAPAPPPMPARAPAPQPQPSPGYDPGMSSTGYNADPTQVPPVPPGFFLSPARATVLTVVMILLLAVAFGAGLLVGRFL